MQIFIDQILIHEQLGISSFKMVNVVNALIKEVEITLKKLAGSNAFVENEQWNIIHMKQKFHPWFVNILQIIYQNKN